MHCPTWGDALRPGTWESHDGRAVPSPTGGASTGEKLRISQSRSRDRAGKLESGSLPARLVLKNGRL